VEGADYVLLVTDKNLNVLGDPIVCWTSIDVTLRFNQPGSAQFVVPGWPWIREQLDTTSRVMCIRSAVPSIGYPGEVLLAGPIEESLYERSDDGENGGAGTFTVTFADDMSWLGGRIVYPNPAQTPSGQTSDYYQLTATNAETALRNLANLNAGPGALTERRVPTLALGAVAGIGTNVDVKTRLEPMLDVMRAVASTGGDLGFRTRQVGNQILFEVYQPQDKSGEVRFSFDLGNLKYVGYNVKSPVVTAAIVGGQGEGADRFLIERVDTVDVARYGRVETLVSRPGSDAVADLQAAGDEALKEQGENARLATTTMDTPFQRYGIHYGLGTKVSVEVYPGQVLTDRVQTVHLQAFATAGEVVTATVGSQAAVYDPTWIRKLRDMDRRVGYLERNVMPSAV
jgi:hypothetical protein